MSSQSSYKSYKQSMPYVRFAAEEACAGAGFQAVHVINFDGGLKVVGERKPQMGFFTGQGGEHVQVDIWEDGPMTKVAIESRLSASRHSDFWAQRHLDGRIASYLDSYLQENESAKHLIVEKK
jgi:hypothetical protein